MTGASSGLGRYAALGLAAAGADVAVVARRRRQLDAVASTVKQMGRRCVVVEGDVSNPETAERTAQTCLEELGRIDVLLNNAGIGTAVPALRESPAEFRRVLHVNLEGAYWMAQACARAMGPGSSIINVSSVLGLTTAGLPQAAYAASKAGLIGLTRDLAAQWGSRRGIRVNAVAPGWFASEMTDQYQDGYLEEMQSRRIILKRLGEPDEFVAVVQFLASEASSYITGVTLPVDGGALVT